MHDDDAAPPLRTELRAQLEQVAEALDIDGRGTHDLHVRFIDGHVRWWSTSRVRMPASALALLHPPATADS